MEVAKAVAWVIAVLEEAGAAVAAMPLVDAQWLAKAFSIVGVARNTSRKLTPAPRVLREFC